MTTKKRATFALLTALAAVQADAGAPNVEVIASGLDNPRGLGFASNGDLYVAEAGSGGSGKCRPSPDGQPVEVCYGETGALTRIDIGGKKPPRRVIEGLPSMASAGGFAASSGPVDVSFRGSTAFVVMGWGGDPALRAGIGPKSRLFGTVLLVTPEGQYFPISDISANEQRHNPAGGPVDSNPYGVRSAREPAHRRRRGRQCTHSSRNRWTCCCRTAIARSQCCRQPPSALKPCQRLW